MNIYRVTYRRVVVTTSGCVRQVVVSRNAVVAKDFADAERLCSPTKDIYISSIKFLSVDISNCEARQRAALLGAGM